MAGIAIDLDIPRTQLQAPRCLSLAQLKSTIKRADFIDLENYTLEEKGSRYTYSRLATEQDYAKLLNSPNPSIEGRLKTSAKLMCLKCAEQFQDKDEYQSHFLMPCAKSRKYSLSSVSLPVKEEGETRSLLVANDQSSIRALLSALGECLPICTQGIHHRQTDIRAETTPASLQLRTALESQHHTLPILPLDIWNILSLELIQQPDCLTQDPPVLFAVFSGRKQLCLDVQVSVVLKTDSMTEILDTLQIESISKETMLALLWDVPPSSKAIFTVLHRLGDKTMVKGQNLYVASLVVGRGLVALSVTPGALGVTLQSNNAKVDLSVEDCYRFLVQWELKPDIVFLRDSGPSILTQLRGEKLKALETMASQAEDIHLVAPVPSIVMRDGEEARIDEDPQEDLEIAKPGIDQEAFGSDQKGSAESAWQCPTCRSMNPYYMRECINCMTNQGKKKFEPPSKTTGKEQYGNGNWECVYCTQSNKANTRTCAGCSKSKIEVLSLSPEESADLVPWTCPKCQALNRAIKSICVKCNTPKSAKPLDSNIERSAQEWICKECAMNNRVSTVICKSCFTRRNESPTPRQKEVWTPRTAPVQQARKEWVCRTCQVKNPDEKSYCSSCYGSKDMNPLPDTDGFSAMNRMKAEVRPPVETQLPKAPETQPTKFERWSCPSCQYNNRQEVLKCVICKTAKTGLEDVLGKPAAMQNDDYWMCSVCKGLNLPEKSNCRKCNAPKSKEEPQISEAEQWTCLQCHMVNRANVGTCRICHTAKLAEDRQPRTEEDRWICSNCGKANSLSRTWCLNCARDKEDANKILIPKEEPEKGPLTWVCVECQSVNQSGRSVCRTCKALKDAVGTGKMIDAGVDRKKCVSCARAIPQDAYFCEACRVAQKADPKLPWVCRSCGTENTGGYCSKCFKRASS